MLGAWVLGLVVLGVLAGAFKGTFSDEFKVPGTESQAAIELIQRNVPHANADGATGRVVFASAGAVDKAAVGRVGEAAGCGAGRGLGGGAGRLQGRPDRLHRPAVLARAG